MSTLGAGTILEPVPTDAEGRLQKAVFTFFFFFVPLRVIFAGSEDWHMGVSLGDHFSTHCPHASFL